MDEMRFGTRTIAGRKWMHKGYRPKCEQKYGYSYCYLFQATQPSSGKSFSMFLPNMDRECFQLFIEEFNKAYPNQTLIMDNAGSHHAKWEDKPKPEVEIIFLPPYSPDFNPQERVFQELKKPLKGKCFEDIDQIKKIIEEAVKDIEIRPQKVMKWTAWNWIVKHNST